jgi:hypothetical protein
MVIHYNCEFYLALLLAAKSPCLFQVLLDTFLQITALPVRDSNLVLLWFLLYLLLLFAVLLLGLLAVIQIVCL